jgi:hypothetical protein
LVSLVRQRNFDALVQERELAQAVGQRVEVVLVHREDALVRQEVNLGAEALTGAHLAQRTDGITLGVVHLPRKTVAPDLDIELFAQSVDAADADAMQTARDLVVRRIELAACMQHRENDLHRRKNFARGQRLVVDRNTAAVVDHRDRVVDMDRHIDLACMAGQRLIDRVVHHLVDQVMQPLLARRADVHGRSQTHGSKAFEDRDVLTGVAPGLGLGGRRRRCFSGGCGGDLFWHERDAPICCEMYS